MKPEISTENLNVKLTFEQEKYLAKKISKDFKTFQNARQSQLNEIEQIKNEIYANDESLKPAWKKQVKLPDLYELAQTLKAHLTECLYSHPEGMFDVMGTTLESQINANKQKAMLVNVFEKIKVEYELEKAINSIIESGESTLFVGWQKKTKKTRRPATISEEFFNKQPSGFVIEEKITYEGAFIKHIEPINFVYDTKQKDNWDTCPKIFKTQSTFNEIISDINNNLLNNEKIENLKNFAISSSDNNKDTKNITLYEFWGNITLESGVTLNNWVIVVTENGNIIRFEPNPFIINPFVHAILIENSITKRGISPLKAALSLNSLSSTVLNKQLDALSLIINPPYLAPKGSFQGEQSVEPGKIIEYDSALMPQQPVPLHFEQALCGWDFIKFFKSEMESATGIYKDISGLNQPAVRTATEINYSIAGQTSRLNMLTEAINRKLIIPMVEKTAEIIANFKFQSEFLLVNLSGKNVYIEITNEIRSAEYIYRYGDRKAGLERKFKLKELFNTISYFTKIPQVADKIDWLECFKFSLEQYGIENTDNFLLNYPQNQ